MGLNFYISFLVVLEYNGNNTINFILDINEISQAEEHRVMPAVCACMHTANTKFGHVIPPEFLTVE